LADGVALDRDLAIGIDECRTEALKERTRGTNRIFRGAEPDTKGEARLVTCLGRLEERIDGPRVSLRWLTRRVHGLHIYVSILLHQVETRAWWLKLVADRCRHRKPMALRSTEVDRGVVHRAVLLDQLGHHIVDRLEAVCVVLWGPGRHVQDVVARFGLRLGGEGDQEFVAGVGETVDLHLDSFPGRPLLYQRIRRLIRARNPVIPQADRQLAGRMRCAHKRRCHR
jgi:hypothetical protein